MKKWSFSKWVALLGLVFAILSFLTALLTVPEFHDRFFAIFSAPSPPPKRSPTIPEDMIGTWEGGLNIDSQHATEKPNVCVIYELATTGTITFRDNCTYGLPDDAVYPKEQITVANGEIIFDEENPNSQDTSQVRMKRVGKNLSVSLQYRGRPYLNGELHPTSVPLSLAHIPRLSDNQCSQLQANPAGPIQGVPGPKHGCPDY